VLNERWISNISSASEISLLSELELVFYDIGLDYKKTTPLQKLRAV